MDFAWFDSHPNVVKYGLSIATFIAGFLVSRFTLSKKERLDVGQKQFENSKALMESQQACFMEFANALKKYANKKANLT